MLFIKCYYFLFASIIFAIAGLCEAISYLNKLRVTWPVKQVFSYRHVTALLHLDFGKG